MQSGAVRLKVPLLCGNLGPGYDTFGLALSRYNYVELRTAAAGITVEIIGEGSDFLPRDTASVVYKAASLVFRKKGLIPPGLFIRLENNIPLGKGLGSFAGAVSAGVYGANCLMGKPFDENVLISLAASKVGSASNVAAAFLGSFTITSRNEQVFFSIPFPDFIQPVLVIPEVPSYNPVEVKRSLPKKISISDANYNVAHAAMLTMALRSRDCAGLLRKAFSERIVTSHRMSYFPGLKEIFIYLNTVPDSYGVSVCNDGPSFICFFDSGSNYKRHMQKIKKLLSLRHISAHMEELSLAGRGIESV